MIQAQGTGRVHRLGYFVATGFLTATMLFSAGMYFSDTAQARADFAALGFPEYLVIPLAVVKLLGLLAVWTRWSKTLLYLAYAGYLFNFVLALLAHWMIRDGDYLPAILALVFLAGSYGFGRRVYGP